MCFVFPSQLKSGPNVRATLAAGRADKSRLEIGQPQIVGPLGLDEEYPDTQKGAGSLNLKALGGSHSSAPSHQGAPKDGRV